MTKIKQPNFKINLQISWAYFWRTSLAVFLSSFIVGFIVGFIDGYATEVYQKSLTDEVYFFVSDVVPILATIIFGIYFWKEVLDLEYDGFTVKVKTEKKIFNNIPSFWMSIRMWWYFYWKLFLIRFSFALLVNFFIESYLQIDEFTSTIIVLSFIFVIEFLATLFICKYFLQHNFDDFVFEIEKKSE